MPVDLDKIRALLASVAGFTEGPWHGDDLGRVVTVRAATPVCDYTPRANRPIIAAAPDLHRELTEAVGEIERLREEMEKPIAEPWEHGRCVRWCGHAEVADVDINGFVGWTVYRDRVAIAHGPESGDAGRHAADLALLAAGYRLVGGVHPLPDEVPDAR